MKRIITLLFTFLFIQVLTPATFADVSSPTQTYTIQISGGSPSITVEGIGVVSENATHGLPKSGQISFTRMIEGTYDGNSWQLTTDKPVGISVTYNQAGTITARMSGLTRDDGYVLRDVQMIPETITFGTTSSDVKRIFKFYPSVHITQTTPSGKYTGKITFTVTGTTP